MFDFFATRRLRRQEDDRRKLALRVQDIAIALDELRHQGVDLGLVRGAYPGLTITPNEVGQGFSVAGPLVEGVTFTVTYYGQDTYGRDEVSEPFFIRRDGGQDFCADTLLLQPQILAGCLALTKVLADNLSLAGDTSGAARSAVAW